MAETPKKSPSKRPARGRKAAAGKIGTDASSRKRDRPEGHPLEWAVGAVSAALILAVVAYLGYRGIFESGRPPDIASRVESIEAVGGVFRVAVSVTNRGGEAAAGVVVSGELDPDQGEAVERGEIAFDYIAAGSTRRGSFLFAQDPEGGDLRISVRGYTEP